MTPWCDTGSSRCVLPFCPSRLSRRAAEFNGADVRSDELCGCHGVGRTDSPSPRRSGRYTRYPVENLAEALAEVSTGHPSMPEFRLDAAQINDVIAYLKTLEALKIAVASSAGAAGARRHWRDGSDVRVGSDDRRIRARAADGTRAFEATRACLRKRRQSTVDLGQSCTGGHGP